MNAFVYIVVFGLIACLAAVHLTTLHYQKKMRGLYSQAAALVAEVGAMEFLMRQTETRLAETHAISLRMENVLKAIVDTTPCDNGECSHMEHILKDFKSIKDRNESILSRSKNGRPKNNG